jgi:hypothetical protein
MIEGGGDAAGWSIFFLLVVILAMLGGIGIFMFRIARREKLHFDPSLPTITATLRILICRRFAQNFHSHESLKISRYPENFSAHGGQVDHMLDVVHWFMIALFVGWTLFFFYCIFRFWHKRSPKASYMGVKATCPATWKSV